MRICRRLRLRVRVCGREHLFPVRTSRQLSRERQRLFQFHRPVRGVEECLHEYDDLRWVSFRTEAVGSASAFPACESGSCAASESGRPYGHCIPRTRRRCCPVLKPPWLRLRDQAQLRSREPLAAILALVVVPCENVAAVELHGLLRKLLVAVEANHARHLNLRAAVWINRRLPRQFRRIRSLHAMRRNRK
jgi:hypothetical protein